jgi:hypothetical protein
MTPGELIAAFQVHALRERLLAESAKAANLEERAHRHSQRALAAEQGYLLFDSIERDDPAYASQHQDLLAAAQEHGLLRPPPPYPQ